MKGITTRLRKVGAFLGCITLLGATANAATFTAITSGKFTSTATWGGTAPVTTILGDIIVIPQGITVDLDQDVELQGTLSSMTINGNITTNNNSDLTLNGGTLLGGGSIMVDEMVMTTNAGINYTGSITAETFTSSDATINSATNLTVNKTLKLMSGQLLLSSGSLTLSSGSSVMATGGVLVTSGGTLNLSNSYNVNYSGNATQAGAELTGSGLTNIEVDVLSSSSVSLSSDLEVTGNLTLTSGTLDLNGHSLTFSGNGDLAASGSGDISVMIGSVAMPNITVNTANGLSGKLTFNSSGNTVNNFTIGLTGTSGNVTLGSDLNIAGALNLQSGIIDADGNTVTVMSSGSLTGGSSSSFVKTGNGGKLMMTVSAGGSGMFHIGTETQYAPAMIMANTGSASSMIGVSAHNNILADGTTGIKSSDTEPVVDATWDVTSTASANLDLDMELMWDATMEVNNFDRSKAYISHYTNANWDVNASAAATMTTSGMYKISRSNVTSLSPFAVASEGAKLAVGDVAQIAADVSVYPNPASDRLTFNANQKIDKVVIYDVSGRMVMTVGANNTNTISVTELNSGIYYAHFFSGQASTVQKFVKR